MSLSILYDSRLLVFRVPYVSWLSCLTYSAVRRAKGRTPRLSDDSTYLVDNPLDGSLVTAPRSHESAKASALKRDGFRCMVTGIPDPKARQFPNLSQISEREATCQTEFSHIFPDKAVGQPELVWKYIKQFGGFNALQELGGRQIHRLSNGLTLALSVHAEFGDLNLWFEKAQEGHPENTYFIKSHGLHHDVPSSTTPVTFTSHDSTLELPDPRYLQLHAAICRVAHLSGAAEYIDQHDRDIEDLLVLAPDGSSADLFAAHLGRTVVVY
ncbi:hypothetical protein DFP72DRAFT_816840 [Ephemerocybe angulata]|uniref:HNH nuclease domain-containing protein n=1 Tax=Ephemerocybe angulata TaxID=980116 RepID=A0A8H6M0R4_9AGAR|nr:hypothetical protein DFP72DRAFT_816840 [Tulosesus angulatus]